MKQYFVLLLTSYYIILYAFLQNLKTLLLC